MAEASWDHVLLRILRETDAAGKARLAREALAAREAFDLAAPPGVAPPDRPGRPERPELVPPQEVPRRGIGSPRGKAALLHALAHIELNAIDLAADMALRFAGEVPGCHRAAFVSDWIQVMGEEGLHFTLLTGRMAELQSAYGDFPAHDGLWDAARKTAGDLYGRLAIAPMILEARGLDVTPGLIARFERVGDAASAAVLTRIYTDEIGHVRTGSYWFRTLLLEIGADPALIFRKSVMNYYPQGPKRPFNDQAREAASLPRDWYEGVAPR